MGSCQDASKKIGLKETDKIRSKKSKSEGRVVQTLHIPAFEACPTEQHDLLKSHEHHELVDQRHVQPDRRGGAQDHEEEREATLGWREVNTAVRLLLPGELAIHACAEAVRAKGKHEIFTDMDKNIRQGTYATPAMPLFSGTFAQ